MAFFYGYQLLIVCTQSSESHTFLLQTLFSYLGYLYYCCTKKKIQNNQTWLQRETEIGKGMFLSVNSPQPQFKRVKEYNEFIATQN